MKDGGKGKKHAETRRRADALGLRGEAGEGEEGWMRGRGKREEKKKVKVKRERERGVGGGVMMN